jgi:hypothetical protein
MKQKENKFRHFLEGNAEMGEKIIKSMKKHRPYMESRNGFICQLILLGLEKLEEIEKRK